MTNGNSHVGIVMLGVAVVPPLTFCSVLWMVLIILKVLGLTTIGWWSGVHIPGYPVVLSWVSAAAVFVLGVKTREW